MKSLLVFRSATLRAQKSSGNLAYRLGFLTISFVLGLAHFANAGVTFTTHLVGTSAGVDEWEIDIASFTGTDATYFHNGITSIIGQITATSGSLIYGGTIAAKMRTNFSDLGTARGGGSTWLNFDSYASNPSFFSTTVGAWTMYTIDSKSDLAPTPTKNNQAGYPLNIFGEVYISAGGSWYLNGAVNTLTNFVVPISINPSGGTSTAITPGGVGLTPAPNTAHPDRGSLAGSGIYQPSVASNTGNIQLNGLGPTTGTEVLLWINGDTAANLKASLAADSGAVIFTQGDLMANPGGFGADLLFNEYTALGNAEGLGAPTLLLFFPAGSANYNSYFDYALPAGDSIFAIAAIPEPATLAMLTTSGIGLLCSRRKRITQVGKS